MDDNLSSIIDIIRVSYPDKTIVDISEFENEEHQTYKFLYETQIEKINQQSEEIHNLVFKVQDLERELSLATKEIEKSKSVNTGLANTASNIMEFVKKFTEQDIYVSSVHATSGNKNNSNKESDKEEDFLMASMSDCPGIYEGKRPSWFSPLKTELSKKNAAIKSTRNTEHILKEKLMFWKRISKKYRRKIPYLENACQEVDQERKKQICKLLLSNCSNQEKYLKYFLLTPGMPKHYMNTLLGAEELGLDANLIIELLEQPEEFLNAEIIEIYVSEAHKGIEYNLKQELAEELIRGDWYVTADINGTTEKFQMVPLELIEDLKKKLDNICRILEKMADEEVCADSAQTSSDTNQYEQDINEYIPEFENDTFLNFDESLLDDMN